MKNITILSIALLAISFTSCKKDRVCECSTVNSAAGSTSSTYTITYKKATKKNAKAACMSLVVQADGDPTSDTRTCTLK